MISFASSVRKNIVLNRLLVRLLLNLSDKINLRRSDILLYQIIVFTIHGNILKSPTKILNLI